MGRLESERLSKASPLSFTGSAERIWRRLTWNRGASKAVWATTAVVLVALAWVLVVGWYVVFGLLVVPWRVLVGRRRRVRKVEDARHRESLDRG